MNSTDLEGYKKLLKRTNEIVILNKQEWQRSGKYFNIFSALGIERKEVRHSAILAELLNPNGMHGLGDFFLKEFLHRISFDSFPTKNAIIKKEEVITNNRRLDISITSYDGNQKIVIENKIDTNDHDNQLSCYLRDLETREKYKLIYLTLNGDYPTEQIDLSKIHCLSYKQDILQMLEDITSIKYLIPHPVLEIIRQYSLTIKSITNQGVDNKMNEELIDLLLKDNNIELIEELNKQVEPLKIKTLMQFVSLLNEVLKLKQVNYKINDSIAVTELENIVKSYIIKKNQWINFIVSLKDDNKSFRFVFDDFGEFWLECKGFDDDKETYSSFLTVLEKQFSYLKINFRQPNEDFKKFALMSSEEQKQYISNFVDEILDRLRVMKLL